MIRTLRWDGWLPLATGVFLGMTAAGVWNAWSVVNAVLLSIGIAHRLAFGSNAQRNQQ